MRSSDPLINGSIQTRGGESGPQASGKGVDLAAPGIALLKDPIGGKGVFALADDLLNGDIMKPMKEALGKNIAGGIINESQANLGTGLGTATSGMGLSEKLSIGKGSGQAMGG